METEEFSSDADEGKRKRSLEEKQADVFYKSRRTLRTPEKVKKNEDKLDTIMSMMQTLIQEVKEIKVEQKKYQEEINSLKDENAEIKKENVKLKNEIREINIKLDSIDRERRRNNIIIQGLKSESTVQVELKEEIKTFLKENLQIDVDIRNAKTVGNKTHLVELVNIQEKVKVMINKNKLKNYKNQRIYINDDMNKSEREIQGKIRKIGQEEKKKGRAVKIGFLQITIDNKKFKWDVEDEELKEMMSKN